MAQSAASRRARAAQAARTAQSAQPGEVKRTPRVQAGFVEESQVRPRRERPAPVKTVRRKKGKNRNPDSSLKCYDKIYESGSRAISFYDKYNKMMDFINGE